MKFEKISLTAKLAAYMRQFTDIPFAQDIAEIIGAQETFEKLLHDHAMQPQDLLWYAPIFELRYKSIAALLERFQIAQVLELASGFTLRGLVMTQDPRVTYVESDLEDLTQEKTTLVAELCQQNQLPVPAQLHFVTVNALAQAELDAALKYFSRDAPLAIVHEGLLQYLSASEMERVARNIRNVLTQFDGIWVTPDFSIKAQAADISEQQRHFRAIVTAATERKMYNNAFDGDAQLCDFFAAMGLHVQEFHQRELVPDLVSPDKLALTPALVEQITAPLKLWRLTL
jgi:O-methyltransferase involved in polyketide biosynthesis